MLEKHERELLVRTRYLVERLPPRMPTEAELAPLIDVFNSEAHTATFEVIEDKAKRLNLFSDYALRRCHAAWAYMVAVGLDVRPRRGRSRLPQRRHPLSAVRRRAGDARAGHRRAARVRLPSGAPRFPGGASPRRARAHAPISGARAQAKRTCGCWVTGVGVVEPGCFFRHVRAGSKPEAFVFVDAMGFEVRRRARRAPACRVGARAG